MESLLQKARTITELASSDEARMDIREVTARLASVTDSTVLAIDTGGRITAMALRKGHQLREEVGMSRELPRAVRETLGSINQTESNLRSEEIFNLMKGGEKDRVAAVIPMVAAGRRFGTLLMIRSDGPFDEKDLLLAEYASGLLEMDARATGAAETAAAGRETAGREQVRASLQALSLSEAEAVWHILTELRNSEGIVVASRVADRVGITRSVIVNALRKLESAMVIRSRSLGMKGTYIKVLNPYLMEELRRVRTRR